MSTLFRIMDQRVRATNYLFEISVKEYLQLAGKIMENNEFQRRRIRSSGTVYQLLKEDLKKGCVIPPLVLALSNSACQDALRNVTTAEEVINYLKENTKYLLILDGLQRTFTLMGLNVELIENSNDALLLSEFLARTIRLELYVGVDRLGILYRMLTLNAGQTPMSLRHQIEILYCDYLSISVEGIQLLTEVDQQRARGVGEYNFKDVIDGFTSYIESNELPIDKVDLLENIKGLEKLSKENQNYDLFRMYLITFHRFFLKMTTIGDGWRLDENDNDVFGEHPFGSNVESIFKKEQVIAAFGAAVGKMRDLKLIDGFESLNDSIDSIKFTETPSVGFIKLLKVLDQIRLKAKKIGNAQRMYFAYFFRDLFNPESDSFQVFDLAVDSAYKKYSSQI